MNKSNLYSLLVLFLICLFLSGTPFSSVVREGDKVYLVDQSGERWDVTQANSIGFRPEGFQYGIGRNAFKPFSDSNLSDDTSSAPSDLRVIGIEKGGHAHAYSVSRLTRHEIANTTLGSSPIVVGY